MTMKKWEYCAARFKFDTPVHGYGGKEELDQFGRDGWELVSAHENRMGWMLWFKREISD
jgi:hypothetical protein